MGTLLFDLGAERVIPFALFALYLITAVKVCSYSSWVRAGAPNPFLPRKIKRSLGCYRIREIIRAEISSIG